MAHNKAVWMARLLARSGPLTKEEIMERWSEVDERGRRMASSTFYDNLNLLADRYGVEVACRAGRYGVERNAAGSIGPAADCPTPTGEPIGSRHRETLSHAIRRRHELLVRYAPFDKPGYEMRFRPYLLRSYRGRCYVVGYSLRHGAVRIFALDRIEGIRPGGATFEADPSFDAGAYFRHSFGIYGGPDLRPEHVVMEVDAPLAPYVRSLPLHRTQRTEALDGGRLRVELDVALTDDLVAELLSYGRHLRVVAPRALCNRLYEEALAVVKSYRKGPAEASDC